MSKTTENLRPGDIIMTLDGAFEILSYPTLVQDHRGRWAFDARNVDTNVIQVHQAQPHWEWDTVEPRKRELPEVPGVGGVQMVGSEGKRKK